MDKSILDVVHETAQDLYAAEVMKETTLREFDALCLPHVKQYSATQIKRIRVKHHASQGVFAAYLNTRRKKTEWRFSEIIESGG
jgi:putative transcriptional regulator